MGEKSLNLQRPHLPRMAFAMKEDELPNPSSIGILGPQAVMANPEAIPELVEEAGRPNVQAFHPGGTGLQ
jgi:hypothetical protein